MCVCVFGEWRLDASLVVDVDEKKKPNARRAREKERKRKYVWIGRPEN